MKRPTDNPVFDRLTRGSGWPSRRTARWVGIGMGAAGLAVGVWALADPAGRPEAMFTTIGLFDIAVGLGGLCLLLVFLVPALIVTREAGGEALAMLRMTNMPAEKILAGIVAAALYRLRLLQAAARWFLPAGAIGLAFMLGTGSARGVINCSVGPICKNWLQVYVVRGSLSAVLIMAGAVVVFPGFMRRLASLGAWMGLKWPGMAPMLAGVIFLAGVIAALLMIWATYWFVFLNVAETLCVYMPILAYLFIGPASQQAISDAIRLINGRIMG